MKQVIVVRKDLKMGSGKIAAQCCHASLKAVLENMAHPNVREWLATKFTKVIVSVDSEEQLLDVLGKAKDRGLVNALITEMTIFNHVPTNTCIALGPAHREDFEGVTSGLKLL